MQQNRISKFGLLEMSRQRLRASLGESSQIVCPRCEGHGRMRSVESLSLSIIRVAEEHAMKDNTGQVLVQAPVEIANFLLNEKRSALREIEQRHDAPIVIVADTRKLTGVLAWWANLYNESHLQFMLLTIVLIPVTGVVFGVIADLIMSRIGIDLKSKDLPGH